MKARRILALCMVMMLVVSAMALPASAATFSGSLTKSEVSKTISSRSSTKYGHGSATLKTYDDSNDGVNLYLDYSTNNSSWTNAKHLFCEPGDSASSGTVYAASTYWRAVMTSWWYNGSGCHAYGTLTVG